MVTKYTRHDFAKVCNISNNALTVYAKRGKIAINSARCIKCENKKKPCNNCRTHEFIDLDYRTKEGFYINLDFFKKNAEGVVIPRKQRATKEKLPPPPKKLEISVPVIVGEDFEESEDEDSESGEINANSSEAALTRAKKFAEIENKKADTRLKELKEMHMRGELIPVSMVQDTIQIFAESIKRYYSDAGENLIMLISERLQAQDHDKAFMRTKLLDGLNKAIDESVNAAQEKLKETKDDDEGGE